MDKDKALDIGYPYGQIIYQSDFSNGSTYNIKKVISADVIDYKYNENYIIVKQVPNEKILIQEIEDNLAISLDFYEKKNQKIILKRDTIVNKLDDRKQIKSIVDSIIKNDNAIQNMPKNEFNYYIVDKDKNIVFGSFDKNSFEVIKKEKGIRLEFVE